MSWFDGFGLLFVAALLVPNILFAATRRTALKTVTTTPPWNAWSRWGGLAVLF